MTTPLDIVRGHIDSGFKPSNIIIEWDADPPYRVVYDYGGFLSIMGLLATGLPTDALFAPQTRMPALVRNNAKTRAKMFDSIIHQAMVQALQDPEVTGASPPDVAPSESE